MDRYDKDTVEFMEKISADSQKPQQHAPLNEEAKDNILRQGFNFAKGLVVGGRKGLAKNIISRGVGIASTLDEMEKSSGIPLMRIYALLNERYGSGWHDWEPETLWQTLLIEEGIKTSDEVKNIVGALQTISMTNLPFEDWSTFENVGQALNENPVHFGQVQPLEPNEASFCYMVLKTIRPKEEFEDDVLAYIAACAKNAGMVHLPTKLFPKGSQEFLDKMGNDTDLAKRVADLYSNNITKLDESTPAGVQLARLREIAEYVTERGQW